MNTSLLAQIADHDYLLKAWKALNKSNKASRGLSNITIKTFEDNLSHYINEISSKLLCGSYKFSKVRGIKIAKNNSNEFRPLRIGEIEDRLLQKALATKLDELLSSKYKLDNECSFAYRKGKNINNAIEKMVEYYKLGYKIILEADIIKFFDTVTKSNLLEDIFKELPDHSIDQLLEAAIKQEIGNPGDFTREEFEKYFLSTESGIPQGNALSPLLANIYLSGFDQLMISSNFKMIRYADDFIVMCKSVDEAKKALELAKEELEKNLNLNIHAIGPSNDIKAKTRIINPQIHKFSFLSIRFDGKRCWVHELKVETLFSKIKSLIEQDKVASSGLLPTMISLKNTIEGWIAAYHFVDLSLVLPELDKLVNRNLYLLFCNLGLNLNKDSLEKFSYKNKSNMVLGLNKKQRINTGIPYCDTIWKKMKNGTPKVAHRAFEKVDKPVK